jgi:hypothetical protein
MFPPRPRLFRCNEIYLRFARFFVAFFFAGAFFFTAFFRFVAFFAAFFFLFAIVPLLFLVDIYSPTTGTSINTIIRRVNAFFCT